MCGIVGIVTPPGVVPSERVLSAMTRTLHRRGPDDQGLYIDAAGGCGLGHRRLSIIDLSGGHQPIATADGRVQAIVNGEIYNFVELRRELESHGHVFATRSDSEVVVHGWVEWGEEVVRRLDGMFALAVWDTRQRTLLLARDRMGKKPMYYAWVGPRSETLIFGSELKALAEHPALERRVDPSALASYLSFECFPETQAIYQQASKLDAGHALVFDRERGRARDFEYWRMRFGDAEGVPDTARWSELELVDHLKTRILEATKARLVSDVPLGVFLSGGIDSSTVAAAMTRLMPAREVKTFAITFEDESFDEGPYSRRVAEHLGTDHREERLSPRTMLDILPEVADFMCEPIGDASIIPTYLLSRFARREVTVALGGDGGDELFLGYPTFQADRVARVLDRVLPEPAQARLGRVALGAARRLPVSHGNFSLDFKIKRFAQGLGWPEDHRHQAWMGSFLPEEIERVLADGYAERALAHDPYARISALRRYPGLRGHEDRLVVQYAKFYLTGCVLVKVDRASMAASLEVRAPLLDTRLVELACALPAHHKLRGNTTKWLLKRAARDWLPADIVDRPKKGFGIPVGAWLRGPLRELAFDLLTSSRIKSDGYFDPKEVARLLREHDTGTADHRKPLWTLLAFQLWHQRFGAGTRASLADAEAEPERPGAVLRAATT